MSSTSNYDYLFKILIVGESGVGKSSILLRFAEDQFVDNYISTIGVDFKIRTIEQEGKYVKLQIWDSAGQERFRAITSSYFRGSNGIVIVYDITQRSTFEKVPKWFELINQSDAAPDVCKIIIGNKCDLENREVSVEDGEALAREYNVPFMETSAKTSKNVDEFFFEMAKILREKGSSETMKDIPSAPVPVSLKGTSVGDKKCPC